MVRLLCTEDHGWYVSRLLDSHNHPLSPTVNERRQWGSHNKIDPVARDLIRNLRSNNIPLSRLCGVLGSTLGQATNAQFTRASLRGLCARMSQESIVDDIGKTLRILRGMQCDDPNLAVCIDSDEAGRVRSILWCTGKNRSNYVCFGDAITFDTTYRTNLYDMPFGLFVGVNNHFQSIVFGVVFLRHETTESFEWAFSTFVGMMQGKAPVTMLTDQCVAMESAIRSVLPNTRHRWCRWHVLRKAKEKLGGVYCKYGAFKREFHDLVTNILCPHEFENSWKDLEMLSGIAAEEAREDHVTRQKRRHIRIGVPIECCAASVYTRAMFDKFSNELYASGSLIVNEEEQSSVFRISKASLEDDTHSTPVWIVKCYTDLDVPRMDCTCGQFEHMAMPCRHMLKVLVHTSAAVIPAGNIHKRWTVTARDTGFAHPTIGVVGHLAGDEWQEEGTCCTSQQRILCVKALLAMKVTKLL